MTEKRFIYDKPVVAFSKGGIYDAVTDKSYEFTMDTVLDLLNEQSETIQQLKSTNAEMEDYNARLEEKVKETLQEEYIECKTYNDADGKILLEEIAEELGVELK